MNLDEVEKILNGLRAKAAKRLYWRELTAPGERGFLEACREAVGENDLATIEEWLTAKQHLLDCAPRPDLVRMHLECAKIILEADKEASEIN